VSHPEFIFCSQNPQNHSYIVDLNIAVVRKDKKNRNLIEFEPYFSDNCLFLESLKEPTWPKKAYLLDQDP